MRDGGRESIARRDAVIVDLLSSGICIAFWLRSCYIDEVVMVVVVMVVVVRGGDGSILIIEFLKVVIFFEP